MHNKIRTDIQFFWFLDWHSFRALLTTATISGPPFSIMLINVLALSPVLTMTLPANTEKLAKRHSSVFSKTRVKKWLTWDCKVYFYTKTPVILKSICKEKYSSCFIRYLFSYFEKSDFIFWIKKKKIVLMLSLECLTFHWSLKILSSAQNCVEVNIQNHILKKKD